MITSSSNEYVCASGICLHVQGWLTFLELEKSISLLFSLHIFLACFQLFEYYCRFSSPFVTDRFNERFRRIEKKVRGTVSCSSHNTSLLFLPTVKLSQLYHCTHRDQRSLLNQFADFSLGNTLVPVLIIPIHVLIIRSRLMIFHSKYL